MATAVGANGHDISTAGTQQIATNGRDFLQTLDLATENEMLDMDSAHSQGAYAIAYLRSIGAINADRGLTIHAYWYHPGDNRNYLTRIPVLPSTTVVSMIKGYRQCASYAIAP